MKRTAIIIFLLFQAWISNSQDSYHREPSREVSDFHYLEQIEKKYNVQIFYKKSWIKGTNLKQVSLSGTLDSVLEETFENSSLRYYIHQKNYIILSHYEPIVRIKEEIPETTLASAPKKEISPEKREKLQYQIHQIGIPGKSTESALLTGTIEAWETQKPLEGAHIFTDDGKWGTTSDMHGKYALQLPPGYHLLYIHYIGRSQETRKIQLYSDGNLDVNLVRKMEEIEQVTIVGETKRKEQKMVGFESMQMKEFSELPSVMGEANIVQHSLLLPGIQTVREGSSSFSVRGGKADQNLMLIDGMHCYSNAHFFGFFPGFNPNTIQKADLFKAAIPIQFGNRLSSVYEISTEKGDFKSYHVNGGVNPFTGNVTIEGPIIEDKLSFMGSVRGTYSNWAMKKIDVAELRGSEANFMDYQAKLDFRLNSKSNASLLLYNSQDNFTLHQDTTFSFQNQLAVLNWNYQINDDMLLWTTTGFTNYKNGHITTPSERYAKRENQNLSDIKFQAGLNYEPHPDHKITGGIETIYHKLSPWSLNKEGEESTIIPRTMKDEKALLNTFFLSDQIDLMPRLTVDLGVRLSLYNTLGPDKKYIYSNGRIREENLQDTLYYKKNETAYKNMGLGIRISGSYQHRSNQFFNFGFSRNNQFIHLLTNNQSVSPIDSWKLSSFYIPPQTANQASVGYNLDILSPALTISADIYYKWMKNLKDFSLGSEFKFNQHPETELINGKGKAYGLEIMVKKRKGRMSGWLSYTYSRTFIQSKSEITEKNINNGAYYPASNDRPHNLSAVLNLMPSRSLEISNIINFSSGVPMTLPVAKMKIGNTYSILYSDRNEYRIPHNFRWDFSITYRGNLKKNKLVQGSWTFSVYNVTGRNNPYSVYYLNNNNNIKGYQLSIIGNPIPTITYKFKF